MIERFPSVGTHNTYIRDDKDKIVVQKQSNTTYSQPTREGNTAYPAEHHYRDTTDKQA